MTYTEIGDVNMTGAGIGRVLVYVNDVVPIFIPLTLIIFCAMITIATHMVQARRTGQGDMSSSLAVGTFATFALALGMSMINGLMNPLYLAMSFVATVIAVFWLLNSIRGD